jgi:hypothetical protein
MICLTRVPFVISSLRTRTKDFPHIDTYIHTYIHTNIHTNTCCYNGSWYVWPECLSWFPHYVHARKTFPLPPPQANVPWCLSDDWGVLYPANYACIYVYICIYMHTHTYTYITFECMRECYVWKCKCYVCKTPLWLITQADVPWRL